MSTGGSTIEGDIKIVLTSDDRGSAEFKSAIDNVRRTYRDARREVQAVNQAFYIQNRGFFETMRTLQKVGSVARQIGATYQRYNIMQLRVADAARTVREAQESVNRAFAEGGPLSEEYIDAVKRYNDAVEDQKRLQQETQLAMVGMGFEFLTTAGILTQTFLPKLAKLKEELKALSTMKKISIAIAVALAITAGIMAYEYFSQPGEQRPASDLRNALNGLSPGLGDNLNDVIANAMNAIPQALGFGPIAATTEMLRQQTGGASTVAGASAPGGGPAYMYNFYGYDPDQVNSAIANGAQNAQMFTGGN